MSETDILRRFLFEKHHVRGELVHLNASYQAVLSRHQYPDAVGELLGQALAASTLLAATIKFDGSLTLQMHSQGFVKLLLAKCTHDLHVRGLAHYQEDQPTPAITELLSSGHLMIAIDQLNPPNRYQGVVECHGQRFAHAIEQYFMQSEQLPTRIWLAANGKSACGLLLQQIPAEGDTEPEAWNNIMTLTETITSDELMLDECIDLLTKLYHEHEVRLFESQMVSFRCQCSIERMENALKTMSLDEVKAILSTHKTIDVNCEFCNSQYSFDNVDIERIFKQGMTGDSSAQH